MSSSQQQQQRQQQQQQSNGRGHGVSSDEGRAAYVPDYYDDAADLRNWLAHRDAVHGRGTGETQSCGPRPSAPGFRPYVDEDDAAADDGARPERPKRSRAPFTDVTDRHREAAGDDGGATRDTRGLKDVVDGGGARRDTRGLWDEVARARRGRTRLLRSFERRREALEREMRRVLLAVRLARRRRRVSDLKRELHADVAERRRQQQQQQQRDADGPGGDVFISS